MRFEEYVAKTRAAAVAINLPVKWDMAVGRFRILTSHSHFKEFFDPYVDKADAFSLMCILKIRPQFRPFVSSSTVSYAYLAVDLEEISLTLDMKSMDPDEVQHSVVELTYLIARAMFPGVEDVLTREEYHDRASEGAGRGDNEVGTEEGGNPGCFSTGGLAPKSD